jgi:hypothetical protein
VASKAMLLQARRLATTARAIAAGNVRWQQARETNGPRAYDGLIRQRAAHGMAARREAGAQDEGHEAEADAVADAQAAPRVEAEALLVWSSMPETQRRLYFMQEHTFPHDHPGVVPMVKRLFASGKFSLKRGEHQRVFDDFTLWKRACPACQLTQNASTGDHPVGLIPSRPFFDLSVDFLDIPADVEGNTSVFAGVDNFSGFAQLHPCKRKDARQAVRCLLRSFADFGKPVTIRSDQGPAFESEICNELNRRMGIESHRTVPHHHQANGIVERVNGKVLRTLSACVLDERVKPNTRMQWADVLPFVQLAINTSVSTRTGVSPSQLVFGEGFLDLNRGLFDTEADRKLFTTESERNLGFPPVDPESYVEALTHVQTAVLETAMLAHSRYIEKALAGRQVIADEVYIPGQYVVVQFPLDQSRDKLSPKWTGPFKVLQQSGSNVYTVLDTVRKTSRDVSTTQMLRFNWDWFKDVEGDDAAMAEHARKLAELAHSEPSLTVKAVLKARARKSLRAAAREVPFVSGRGRQALASFDFLVSFDEHPHRQDWRSATSLEDNPVFEEFLNTFPNWRADQGRR